MSKKIINLPISKFIDTNFRSYSLHVIQSRGIPSFYDALTPVQRFILMNTPSSNTKTLSIVGECIKDSYHHGDNSLSKSISRLARPFGSALRFLDGYGFFGTEVCPEPAAARYTSVKLNSKVNSILKKYHYLTTREKDGPYNPFWLDVPVGLCTSIVGIAVGYKSIILPRKLEDIQKYLEGKIKSLKPYFTDFNGKIEKHKELNNAWLISSNITIEGNRIKVREIPPILKYASVLKRIDYLFNKFDTKIRVVNNSNTKVIIDVIYTGQKQEEWEEIQTFVNKIFSIIVTENIVFVKDNKVLVYDSVEEYLEDYKWQILRLKYYNTLYERDHLSLDLIFNEAKEQFINFILLKKRTINEIDVFLDPYIAEIKDRLERMTSKKFTKDELIETITKIKELKKDLINKEKELKISQKEFNKVIDPTEERSIKSKKSNSDLFNVDDIEEINGVYIWNGEDIVEKDEKDFEEEE